MRKTRFSKVVALLLVFVMIMSTTAFGAIVPGTKISNTLEATFNVSDIAEGKVKNVNKNQYYDTIQEALNDAADNDTIKVGAGMFEEKVTIVKPVNLIGSGIGKTILNPIEGAKRTLIIGNEGGSGYGLDLSGTVIKGFTINTPIPSDQATSAIYITSQGSKDNEIIISNNEIIGLIGEQPKNHVGIETPYSDSIKNIKISYNTLNSFKYGMYFNNMSNIDINNNSIDGTIRGGIVFYGKPEYKCNYINIYNNNLTNISSATEASHPLYDSGIGFYHYGENTVVENNNIAMLNGRDQIYYYVEETDAADVANLADFKKALENTDINTINITDTINTTEEIVVNRPITINGGKNTIEFSGDETGWNGDYVLHVYKTSGVIIKDVNLTGADGALLVNGSEVELTGTVDVSGNEFGGIEVSKGLNVTNDPKLTITGTIFNSDEAIALPTVWEDEVEGRVSSTTLKLINIGINGQQQYYLEESNTIPVELRGLEGAIDATVGQTHEAIIIADKKARVVSVENASLAIVVTKSGITTSDLSIEGFTPSVVDGKVIFTRALEEENIVNITFNNVGVYNFDVYVTQ